MKILCHKNFGLAIDYYICIYVYIHTYFCLCPYNRKAAFKAKHNKIHLNLSIALLLGLIVFVSGIETAKDNKVSIHIILTF